MRFFVSGNDETGFCPDDLNTMKISSSVAERGHDYFMQNKVCYICLDETSGRVIVEGTQIHKLEFEYLDGGIRNLTCNCFCSYPCKHEFAAMLQLKETLGIIEKNYLEVYGENDYFAAVGKGILFHFTIDEKTRKHPAVTSGITPASSSGVNRIPKQRFLS